MATEQEQQREHYEALNRAYKNVQADFMKLAEQFNQLQKHQERLIELNVKEQETVEDLMKLNRRLTKDFRDLKKEKKKWLEQEDMLETIIQMKCQECIQLEQLHHDHAEIINNQEEQIKGLKEQIELLKKIDDNWFSSHFKKNWNDFVLIQ